MFPSGRITIGGTKLAIDRGSLETIGSERRCINYSMAVDLRGPEASGLVGTCILQENQRSSLQYLWKSFRRNKTHVLE